MRVRVDATRKHVLAGSVDHAIGVDVERLADHRDALALDVDVADVVVGRCDDPPTRDQCRHVISPPSARALGRPRGRPRTTPRRYLPPSFRTTTDFLNFLPVTSQP